MTDRPKAGARARRAVIDVGTNAVKLLVAEIIEDVAHPVLKLSLQTNLGRGAFRTGELPRAAISRTADAVGEFAAQAKELGAVSVRVLAAGAIGEARNAGELAGAIRQSAGLKLEVLSAEQEAEYVLLGVFSNAALPEPVLILDVGGGSSRWIATDQGTTRATSSFPLGTMRLLDECAPADPPTTGDLVRCRRAAADIFEREARPDLQPVLASFAGRRITMVGLGGSLKTLARTQSRQTSSPAGQQLSINRQQLSAQINELWRASAHERRQLPALDPEKAEVILAGSLIFEAAMQALGVEDMLVSPRGLRDGAVLHDDRKSEA